MQENCFGFEGLTEIIDRKGHNNRGAIYKITSNQLIHHHKIIRKINGLTIAVRITLLFWIYNTDIGKL